MKRKLKVFKNDKSIENDEISSEDEIFYQENQEENSTDLDSDHFFENEDEKKVALAKKYLRKIDKRDDIEKEASLSIIEGKIIEKEIADNLSMGESHFYKGHKLSPTCLVLDRDNRTIYSGGKDCAIIRWDIETGKKIIFPGSRKDFNCGGHFEQVRTICINYESNLLCSGGDDRVIRLWDYRAPKCIEKLHGHTNSITGIVNEINSDMGQIISVSYDKSVKVWSLATRTHMNTYYGHTNKITCCDIAVKDRLLTGSEDNTSRLWKLSADSHLIFYSGNYNSNSEKSLESPIDSVSCLNSINHITGQQNGTLSIWSQNKKKPLINLTRVHDGAITSVKSVPFTDLFFTGSCDGNIKSWKWFDDKLTPINDIPIKGFVNDIAVSDKLLVAAIGQEHRLGRWQTMKDSKNGIFIQHLSY